MTTETVPLTAWPSEMRCRLTPTWMKAAGICAVTDIPVTVAGTPAEADAGAAPSRTIGIWVAPACTLLVHAFGTAGAAPRAGPPKVGSRPMTRQTSAAARPNTCAGATRVERRARTRVVTDLALTPTALPPLTLSGGSRNAYSCCPSLPSRANRVGVASPRRAAVPRTERCESSLVFSCHIPVSQVSPFVMSPSRSCVKQERHGEWSMVVTSGNHQPRPAQRVQSWLSKWDSTHLHDHAT